MLKIHFKLFALLLFVAANVFAEGTKEAMPNSANGVALNIRQATASGPYRGAPAANRLRFFIGSHTTENFYFGFRGYNRGTSAQVAPWYRIVDAGGAQVTAPAQMTIGAQIGTYTQAVNGPNIGGVTTGYAPVTFDPTANGEYYIEIYESTDAGATTANQQTYLTLFDFTVAHNTTGVKYPGRVYSQGWSFITYLTATNIADASVPLEGDFFGLTSDNLVAKLAFNDGFKPLAFVLFFNKYGVTNGGDWVTDRRSVFSGATSPNLDGYRVFLNIPDATQFPQITAPAAPTFTRLFGCPGGYFFAFKTTAPGDVAILLNLNGVPGYQTGTSDRFLFAYDVPAGSNVLSWNGLNGLGAAVTSNINLEATLYLRLGRTNLPMFDAELNQKGFTISGVGSSDPYPKVYWDDASLGAAGGTCGNDLNVTGSGIDNSIIGVTGSVTIATRAWDGPGAGTAVPAPIGATDGSNSADLCDDFGNARTLNTWFYPLELYSANMVNTPVCDRDGDGVSDNTDIDDDNDGIPDTAESSTGLNPQGDADSDGVPNYLDPSSAGFADNDNNGVDDRYDSDGDGVINAYDLDSDNDGITDIVEAGGIDTNGDGRVDVLTDTDGDGLANTYDTTNGGVNIANLDTDLDGIPNFRDLDSDNDGIPDLVEAGGTDANNDGRIDGYVDTDNDGLSDMVDGDTGNDGTAENTAGALIITTTVGGTPGRPASYPRANQDGNGLPNPYDLDADGDGIVDTRESGLALDINNDGVINGTDTGFADANGDGWADNADALATLTLTNTDGRGRANYLDIDADDDGIVDNLEGQTTAGYTTPSGTDTDGDGIDNAYDNVDTNGTFGGNANNGITPTNSDAIDLVDYLDLDSDNDGYPDSFEGHDTTGDNLPDAGSNANNGVSGGLTDADGDGLLDGYDNNTASVDPTNGTTATSYPNIDNTGTTERDWREVANTDNTGGGNTTDVDDDNDGITDIIECGGFDPLGDADGDGIRNYLDPTPGTGLPAFADANGDGINDAYDNDRDGIINSLDLDSDNDGITDIVEAGGVDTNGDGTVDVITDTDGDGLANTYDTDNGGVNIANLDTDGDGIPNFRDLDSDNDGIPDVVEAGGLDANNDGRLDGYTDTDGDGLAQIVDGDSTNDGTAENTANALIVTGTDGNADGRPDTYAKGNTDRRGLPNPYDLDADGDGILDTREAGIAQDTNNDGVVNSGDTGFADANGDGWADNVDALGALTPPNTDGRGGANYLDIDADDDGLTDNVEGQTTAGYQLPAGIDTDGDGIDDAYDNADGTFAGAPNNGIVPNNHDGADVADYLDSDSDNDGVIDLKEGTGNPSATLTNTADTDGDGLVDQFDTFNLIAQTMNLQNNVTVTGMGNGGNTTGPSPAGSNVNANQTNGAAPNRDWRNGLQVLPVKLTNFSAVYHNNATKLNWTATAETSFSHYEIERSSNAVNFETISNVQAKGTGGDYAGTDNNLPAASIVYYRLKMVDVNGNFTHSKIISIRLNTVSPKLTLYPNPVVDLVNINLTATSPEKVTVNVYAANGKLVIAKSYQVQTGVNTLQLDDLKNLAKGDYILEVVGSQLRQSQKFIHLK